MWIHQEVTAAQSRPCGMLLHRGVLIERGVKEGTRVCVRVERWLLRCPAQPARHTAAGLVNASRFGTWRSKAVQAGGRPGLMGARRTGPHGELQYL